MVVAVYEGKNLPNSFLLIITLNKLYICVNYLKQPSHDDPRKIAVVDLSRQMPGVVDPSQTLSRDLSKKLWKKSCPQLYGETKWKVETMNLKNMAIYCH